MAQFEHIVHCGGGNSTTVEMTPEQQAVFEASRVDQVPASISDRQFAHQLMKQGIISFAEALAFVQTGTIPSALSALIAGIQDQNDREAAELLIAGNVEFRRNSPLTASLAAAYGWSVETTDNFWRAAALL